MSESPKPLPFELILFEVILGLAYGFAMTAYLWDMPPSVNPGALVSLLMVTSRLVFFALIMWLFNSGWRRRSPAMLGSAVFLSFVLLLFSFPQY